METRIYADALLILTYVLALCWVVVILTILLVRKRWQMLPAYYFPILGTTELIPKRSNRALSAKQTPKPVQPLFGKQGATLPLIALEHAIKPDLPAEWRLPVQEGTPDQLVIHIEPDGTPTEAQLNIQKLIRHFQTMPTQPPSKP